MTEEHPRTGAARDVPPPRPVRAPVSEPDDGGPLGRAARAVADAVGGLLGTPPGDDPGTRPAAGLREVLSALAARVPDE